jgi:hypothetical protein
MGNEARSLQAGGGANATARKSWSRGLVFSGMSRNGELPEIVERPDHPWFIGEQFHPELKSKPFDPHPLFASLLGCGEAEPLGLGSATVLRVSLESLNLFKPRCLWVFDLVNRTRSLFF